MRHGTSGSRVLPLRRFARCGKKNAGEKCCCQGSEDQAPENWATGNQVPEKKSFKKVSEVCVTHVVKRQVSGCRTPLRSDGLLASSWQNFLKLCSFILTG